jgi:hypothetical protein
MKNIYKGEVFCDVAGDHSRPDVFQLLVNEKQRQQVVELKVSNHESDGSGDPEEA